MSKPLTKAEVRIWTRRMKEDIADINNHIAGRGPLDLDLIFDLAMDISGAAAMLIEPTDPAQRERRND